MKRAYFPGDGHIVAYLNKRGGEMEENINRVILCGDVTGEPYLSHVNHGESFYKFPLAVPRLSGQIDELSVVTPQVLLEQVIWRPLYSKWKPLRIRQPSRPL